MRRAVAKLLPQRKRGNTSNNSRRKSSVGGSTVRKQSSAAKGGKRHPVSAAAVEATQPPVEESNEIDSDDDGDFHNIWSGDAPEFSEHDLQEMMQGRYVPNQEEPPQDYQDTDNAIDTASVGSYMDNNTFVQEEAADHQAFGLGISDDLRHTDLPAQEYEAQDGQITPLNERTDLHASLLQTAIPANDFVGDTHYQVSSSRMIVLAGSLRFRSSVV